MEKIISDGEVKAAAKVFAHSEEFNAGLWRKYEDVARAALEAAWEVAEDEALAAAEEKFGSV